MDEVKFIGIFGTHRIMQAGRALELPGSHAKQGQH